ncbi:MAG: DUF4430 domain-containing protein [Patescibacteria group bacterium]
MRQTILIGATVAVVIATIFVYIPRAHEAPQTALVSSAAQATFAVGDKTYSINVASGETVIGAMRALASAGTLSFTGREYPGLGFFIDSINGKKNADGRYWILYVNDVSASVGASATTIRADDVLEWKYEKGY